MKITKEMQEQIKKGQSYTINPKQILVDTEHNPRFDYGNKNPDGSETEEWTAFKDSIRDMGVQQHLKVYYDEVEKKFHLVHGFRRMKAIQELFEEGGDLDNIEYVGIDIVENNVEEAIINHFVLNSGKALNDVEMADGIKRLRDVNGNTNITQIAKKIGVPLQKVYTLLDFADGASTRVKQAVLKGDVSFSTAKAIVKKTPSAKDQNKTLTNLKQESAVTGKKITAAKVDSGEGKLNLETKIGNIIAEIGQLDDVNQEGLNMFKAIIKAIKNDKPIDEIVPLFNVQIAEEV